MLFDQRSFLTALAHQNAYSKEAENDESPYDDGCNDQEKDHHILNVFYFVRTIKISFIQAVKAR
jgi:hypothetical protein